MDSICEKNSRLFEPLVIGKTMLSNRIAMAPLTRVRAQNNHVHQVDLAKEYYSQRAAIPGTMLITEATLISPKASGYSNVPGVWNTEQVGAWKEIVDRVHEKKCFIWLQLWALGRGADATCKDREGTGVVFGPSPIPVQGDGAAGELGHEQKDPTIPREMTEAEIYDLINDYAQAADNAVNGAGFDGVEIHSANGYLPDQFLQDISNQRNDRWGGSIENRSRFVLDVASAVINRVGAERVGIRLSTWSEFQGMKMKDPIPQFSHVIEHPRQLNLAYLHLIEPRVFVSSDRDIVNENESNDPFIKIWANKSPVLLAGGFNLNNAQPCVDEQHEEYDIVCVFGRYFLSTPDLVYRLQHRLPLSKYNRDTFYKVKSPEGYIDYDVSEEFKNAQSSRC